MIGLNIKDTIDEYLAVSKYINWNDDSIFEYKKATIEDIVELVRTRIIVLRAANKLSDDVDVSVVEKESYAYYMRALENGEHIAYLVYDNGTFIGAGGISFYQVMPTYHNPAGKRCEGSGCVTDCVRGNGYGKTIV